MAFDVLLVDDHKIMRDGIKAILARAEDFRVVGEAENGTDAVQFVKLRRPHMVLMDIGLPNGLNGVETTLEVLRAHPECKVVILSMFDDENSVVSAIRGGARVHPQAGVGFGSSRSPAHGRGRWHVSEPAGL